MGAPKGNEYWKLRSKHGRDKLFSTPEELWDAACEYFQWVEENPLKETKGFAYQGTVTKEEFPKMRAMTLSQLCFYLNASEHYWWEFKRQCKANDEKDFLLIIGQIENTIYNQKFQGAAAGLLETNIIARDLGLKDKSDLTSDDKPIQPIQIIVDDSETANELKLLRDGSKAD